MGLMGNNQKESYELDYKTINNIKALGIDMINEAKSGHPGIVLGAASIIYTLYAKHMKIDTKNDKWINRDRFIMSAGHGSALLYATLFMSGFNLKIEDLMNFRKINSKTPGHPEYGITPGVDMTTGPLGQGVASAVGMAIAEKFLNNRYTYDKSKSKSLIDHYTYVLCGDGDLMEGVSYEATSIAGNLSLGKLIILYDSNNITLDTDTKNTFRENIIMRFNAIGFHTEEVSGDDLKAIDDAIIKAKSIVDKPSLIKVNTIIGKGSMLEGTSNVHGKPLTEEDILSLKEKLNIRDVPFTVTQDAYNFMTTKVKERNESVVDAWNTEKERVINNCDDNFKEEFRKLIEGDLSLNASNLTIEFNKDEEESLRDSSEKILNKFINRDVLMLGGSADLSSSTKTYLKDMGEFTRDNPNGRNIRFGVREHAMGAILNGICLSGIKCFGSTFLTFSDYLKPAIRMSALMNLPVIYIFSHDNLTIGEDGPTHQPVEQLVGLRSIPNLEVYRPADINELIGTYKTVLEKKEGPSVIIISKEKAKILESTRANEIKKGGYIVKDSEKPLSGILISCGSELHTVLDIASNLESKGIYTRVISMPCMNRFINEKKDYRDQILLPTIKKIVVEYSSSLSWAGFVYSPKYLICMNSFGTSGGKNDILNKFHLDKESIEMRIEELLK